MENVITDINDVEKEIQIIVPVTDLQPHLEEAYKRHQAKVEVKGFRKGKAPLELVKRIYGESIEYSDLDQIAGDIYRQVVNERNLQPIGEPVLADIDYKRGEKLTFKVKYEVRPVIQLKEYKGIPVEKVIHKVTDKEIEDEIVRLQKANHTMELAEVASDVEHILYGDIQQIDESGNPIIGKKNPDTKIYLANETLYPEIREAMLNCKAGDSRRVKIGREHDDHKHTDILEITVKKIEKVVLPELTDDFIKKVTKEKKSTVKEFREAMYKDVEDYWQDRTGRKLTDDLIGEIVRRHEFTVPESLVKGLLDSFIDDMKNQYPNKKLPEGFDETKYREDNRGYAVFQAKWFLVRERIIETEKLIVEDADLERLAESEATKVGIDKDRLLQFYKTAGSVKERILTDKLMGFLKQHAQITEKVTEEFFN